MQIYNMLLEAVSDSGKLDREDLSTYLGPMTHRLAHINMRLYNGEGGLAWRLKKSKCVPQSLGAIYLPLNFESLIDLLHARPLTKKGIDESADKNLAFLQCEALNWLGMEDQKAAGLYADMWDSVPNVSEYSSVASHRVPELIEKLPSLLSYKGNTDCRSFELRFPGEYCPVVWSLILAPDMASLEASLIFRSVEVSRNILNDLYLFFVYFGYILTHYTEEKLFDINITAINIFAQDAHIIDFGGN
jgi:hypothetical protein